MKTEALTGTYDDPSLALTNAIENECPWHMEPPQPKALAVPQPLEDSPASLEGFTGQPNSKRTIDHVSDASDSPPKKAVAVKEQLDTNPEQDALLKSTDYQKATQALMQAINRAHSEWSRKTREFELQLHKSGCNVDTCGTPIEKKLKDQVAKGEASAAVLRKIEEKWVTQQVITQPEQVSCRNAMNSMVQAAKDGQKIRFLYEGRTVFMLATLCTRTG